MYAVFVLALRGDLVDPNPNATTKGELDNLKHASNTVSICFTEFSKIMTTFKYDEIVYETVLLDRQRPIGSRGIEVRGEWNG